MSAPMWSMWCRGVSRGNSAVRPRVSMRRPNRTSKVFSYSRWESRRMTVRPPVPSNRSRASRRAQRSASTTATRSASVGRGASAGGIAPSVTWSMISSAAISCCGVVNGIANDANSRSPSAASAPWHSKQYRSRKPWIARGAGAGSRAAGSAAGRVSPLRATMTSGRQARNHQDAIGRTTPRTTAATAAYEKVPVLVPKESVSMPSRCTMSRNRLHNGTLFRCGSSRLNSPPP